MSGPRGTIWRGLWPVAIAAAIILAGAVGFVAGRWTAPARHVDLAWQPTPGLALGWSEETAGAIVVYEFGEFVGVLNPVDGERFDRLRSILNDPLGAAETAPQRPEGAGGF